MKANTRLFGEIEIADDKLIRLKDGLIGFPELQNFALIFDEEKEDGGRIKWLQSMDEPSFALPVISPLEVEPFYHPMVSETSLAVLGEMSADDVFMLVTITVPKDITQMSVNLKAPFIINMNNLCAAQIIVDDDYPVKYKIYEKLQLEKEGV